MVVVGVGRPESSEDGRVWIGDDNDSKDDSIFEGISRVKARLESRSDRGSSTMNFVEKNVFIVKDDQEYKKWDGYSGSG